MTSNRNGVISLMIGEGSSQSGNMMSVDWRTAQIHTVITLPGGATLSNTTPVNAVPYAFYADSVDVQWVSDVVDDYLEHHSISSIVETDPTVPDWAKESTKPAYDYSEIANTPDLSGYLTVETDPTVPDWAKETTKPAYDYSEIVNTPDLSGYLTGYTETQTLADVTAQGNSAGNRQLKNVSDPTEPQDAVTKSYLDQLVSNLTGLIQDLQQQLDSLQNVVNALTGGGAVIDEKSCPGTPTVTDHEGNVYATVQIGEQCWMRDNLRTTTSPSTGTYLIPVADADYTYTGKQARWYNNDSATYAPMNFGLLYNWNAAVDTFNTAYGETSVNNSSSNALSVSFPGNRRGVCPAGWHLPSDAEWSQLTDYVGSQSEYTCGSDNTNIAKALASTTGWNTSTSSCGVGNNQSANNATDFSVVPAGNSDGSSFSDAGNFANFWSSTGLSYFAYYRYLYYRYANVSRYNLNKSNGISVRCLRD